MNKVHILIISFLILQGVSYSQTWIEQTSPATGVSLNSISAFNENFAWACGNNGTVIRTTNGGANWVSVGAAPITPTLTLYNIFGTDSLTALVTGTSASATFVFRTSNGGANWIQVFTQNTGFIDAILMGNAVAGFMVGNPVGGRWSLWGTINGGVTWDSANFRLPQVNTETGYNNSFYYQPNIGVWFGTSNTRVYTSTNLIIWNTEVTTGQVNSSAIWFTSATNGMTGGTATLLTTNAGITWSPTATALPGSGNVTGITGLSSNWWVVRQASIIYYTANDGAVWSPQYTAPAGNYNHISGSRVGAPVFYAVRSNGGISKATGFVGINPVSNVIPKEFSLKQNYPNPFNPSTKIKFSVSSLNKGMHPLVQLRVYDVLGNEVAVIVNEQLLPGTYEVNFDASNLSTGVYYYKLTAGEFVQTKKMILVK
jgi:photosystem II stability/assembly factor-like uncharacterized protein